MPLAKSFRSSDSTFLGFLDLVQTCCALFFLVVLLRYYFITLIPFWTLAGFAILVGLVLALITLPLYMKRLTRFKYFFLRNFLFYGLTIPAIFLFINYRFTGNPVETLRLDARQAYQNRRTALFIGLPIHQTDKNILFPEATGSRVPGTVSLLLAKGYFGFTVIKDQQVLEYDN